MKNFIVLSLLSFLLFFSTVSLWSQENKDPNKPDHTFNFYFINGYAISYNFYETEIFYLRAQMDLSTNKEDIDMEGESHQAYTTILNKYKTSGYTDNDYFSVGASAHIVFPLYSNKYGSIYFGTGPIFTYSTRNSAYSETGNQYYPDSNAVQYSSTSTFTNNEKNYDAGVLGLVGVQGIITDNIKLFVKAHIKGGRRWKDTEWESSNTNNVSYSSKTTSSSSGDGWFYEAQFIRLGISISI